MCGLPKVDPIGKISTGQQGGLDEAEQLALKGGKKQIQKLEARVGLPVSIYFHLFPVP